MLGIYIHIPFCKSKCPYCNFVSMETDDATAYITCLNQEITEYLFKQTHTVDSIFFGGGTPSSIQPIYIQSVLQNITSIVDIQENTEITLEANPGTVTIDSLIQYKEMNINRLSFGLQSAVDSELFTLGRIHSFSDFLNSYELAIKTGFENINIDLMFGTPNQTIQSFEQSLKTVIALDPNHISCYSLKIEKNTPYYKTYSGKPCMPNEEQERNMYHLAHQMLCKHGYIHYEISNFAKKGFECKHNLKYWTHQPYFGFGVSAHSLSINKNDEYKRYNNTSNFEKYISDIQDQRIPVVSEETLDDIGIKEEYIMLNLRLNTGIDFDDFKEKFDIDFRKAYTKQIQQLLNCNMITFTDKGIYPTLKGFDLQNSMVGLFL